MNNSNKKYGMGGAVQSFSSPMLAQGMQGGLSGFGTSGLQTFADGGQTTTIQDILAKYKAMESAKAKQDPTTEFLNKSWEGKNLDDYIMYSDKFKKGGEMAKGGIFEHGLQEGDKIVKQVDEKYLIVASKGGVYSVVDIEKGSRFIVGLDDSKTSGKRKSVKAGVKEAMEYINYLKSTKMANGGKFAKGGMLEDAKIYVADLAEYNNGKLVGKWLDLSDYSSGAEVMEAIQEMLDEQTKKDKFGDVHEEYAIHDFEGFPRSFYSEYMGESDFDQLYEIARVADDANLPLDVLMKAMSDLGYEDNAERVAEEYSSSIPASMGNEWRDFAYDWVDSVGIEGVSNIESYFDYEEFGSDIRADYSEEELEEMGYDELSDEELGERNVEEIGGVENLPKKTLEMYFDYAKLGRNLQYNYTAIRGNDGDFYFFNSNFAKGGKLKYAKGGEVKNTIDILMTEEPKVWDKFGFNSGSEIRASKDKTKKYAQELERVFTEKGVKKGSLTKKINEDLTDENYHLLNEFLTRNGYFNSKLTDELLKSYNNPVYSGAYADKEAITIEEKAKAKTSGAKKIQLKKLSAKTTYIPNREIDSIELESGETLSKNDIVDGIYRANKKFAKGGEFDSIDFSDFSFDTDGDYEDRDVEEEKIKYLRTKVDFDKVRGYIDYRKEKNNTYLRFFKNGELVMRIKGDGNPDGVFAEISAFGNIGYLNYHPQDGFGGLNMIEFKREVNRVFEDFSQENKQYAKGGEVDESNMDIQFIEYGDYEIMYEPHYKKYYANDVEFDSLEKAKKFLDSGAVSSHTKGAYERGLFAKGGEVDGDKMGSQAIADEYKKYLDPKGTTTNPTREGHIVLKESDVETITDWVIFEQLGKPIRFLSLKKMPHIGFAQVYYRPNTAYHPEENYQLWSNFKMNVSELQDYVVSTKIIKDMKKSVFIYPFNSGKLVLKDGSEQNIKSITLYFDELSQTYKEKFAKGGKIGFEGLAKKVAKRYVGRKVSKEYQAEYGKTYDANEAKEVGNKVAGKVYKQQVAKKKIVRKLQRKTK